MARAAFAAWTDITAACLSKVIFIAVVIFICIRVLGFRV